MEKNGGFPLQNVSLPERKRHVWRFAASIVESHVGTVPCPTTIDAETLQNLCRQLGFLSWPPCPQNNQPTNQTTNQPTNQPTTQPASQPTNQPNNQTTKQTTTRIRFWEWSSVYLVNPKPTGFKWMKIGGKMPIIKVKQPFKTGSLYFKVSISSNLFQIVIFVVQFFVFRRHQQKKAFHHTASTKNPHHPPPPFFHHVPLPCLVGLHQTPKKADEASKALMFFLGGKPLRMVEITKSS